DAVHYVAAAAILCFAVLNIVGVNLSAAVLNLTTGLKYAALLALVLAAFLLGAHNPMPAPAQASAGPGTATLASFGLALISILWVYDGWGDVTFVSGEVRQPER